MWNRSLAGATGSRELDLVPDLGDNIGSAEWWRGLATLTLLCGTAIATFPGMQPLAAGGAPALGAADFNEARAQMIVPLALGGDTGRHMAATDAVRPLTQTPERPQIELTATLGSGDSFARLLERSGVGSSEAQALASQVAGAGPARRHRAGHAHRPRFSAAAPRARCRARSRRWRCARASTCASRWSGKAAGW